MISLYADKVKVSGPKVDGGYTVSFDVGQDEQRNVALLLAVPQQTTVKLTVDAA